MFECLSRHIREKKKCNFVFQQFCWIEDVCLLWIVHPYLFLQFTGILVTFHGPWISDKWLVIKTQFVELLFYKHIVTRRAIYMATCLFSMVNAYS